MGEIIEFKGNDIEEKFIESLNDWQLEIFYDIIESARMKCEEMSINYYQKVAECAVLKAEIEALKGAEDDT